MAAWFNGISPEIETALIAAFATLVGIILKDFLINWWNDQRRARKDALTIYRNYADPIASAGSALFWRLRETLLEEGRGAFLKSSGKPTQFDQYKYESTLYRFAALIGWLRAYRRELTFFSLNSPNKLSRLRDSIHNLEKSLSDGAHVETQRARSLATLWRLPLPTNENEVSSLGVAIEQVLKPALQSQDASVANDLDHAARLELCEKVANVMSTRLRLDPLPTSVIEETVGRAIHSLSIREAWLYRDFQSAIGDLMVKEVSGGARRFEVLGFGEFEDLLVSREIHAQRCVQRLNRMIDGLDISGADRFDARVQMLEDTFLAIIELLEALEEVDPRRGVVSDSLLTKAKGLARDTSWRKSVTAN